MRITALAQDGRHVAWLRPKALRPVGILDVVSRRRVSLPAHRFSSELGVPERLSEPIALSGDRAIYVLYEAQGNTEEHFYVVTASMRDRTERVLEVASEANRPYAPGDGPSWVAEADGKTILFQSEAGGLERLVGRRVVRVLRNLPGPLAVSGTRFASAQRTSDGGCICNLAPSWSPDGASIVFGSGTQVGPDEIGETRRVRVVPASGGASRVLALGSDPDWSPDGAWIAFNRGSVIYVIHPDGTGERRLLAGAQPAWSPDGTRIAFMRDRAIWIAAADGSAPRRLYAGFSPHWSPDGSRLAFDSGGDVYLGNAEGGGVRRLTSVPPGGSTIAVYPAWSPNGALIAYTLAEFDEFVGGYRSTQLWVMNPDGTGQRRVAAARNALTPAWSPDGTRLAYGGWLPERNPVSRATSTEVFTARLDGSDERRVTTATPAEPRSVGFVKSLDRRRRSVPFRITGAVEAVTLSPRVVAALAVDFSGQRIEVFDPKTGRMRREIAVSDVATRSISSSRWWVVYSVGREIKVLNARTGAQKTIALAATDPTTVSIEGRRVAWVENIHGHGRIRALTLRGS